MTDYEAVRLKAIAFLKGLLKEMGNSMDKEVLEKIEERVQRLTKKDFMVTELESDEKALVGSLLVHNKKGKVAYTWRATGDALWEHSGPFSGGAHVILNLGSSIVFFHIGPKGNVEGMHFAVTPKSSTAPEVIGPVFSHKEDSIVIVHSGEAAKEEGFRRSRHSLHVPRKKKRRGRPPVRPD